MPFPSNITRITVTARYVDLQGNPAQGNVLFTPTSSLINPTDGSIIIAQTITKTLDANGELSILLPVTDDTDAIPVNFTYTIQEQWPDGRTFNIALPANLGATVDLADIAPVQASTGTNTYATTTQYLLVSSRVVALETTATTLSTYTATAATAAAAANTAATAATQASITASALNTHPFMLMG